MNRALPILAVSAALLGTGAAEASGGACPAPDFARQAQAAIRAYTDEDSFSGAVLVAVDGRPVLREGVGLANRELMAANTPETKFRIGSITKQFTSAAILQLAEAGKLSLEDPISKYYAAAPASWSKVTIRHLLAHSSGIPSYTGLPGFFERQARLPMTPEEIVRLTQDQPLEFEPGSGYAYDNTGYILLGYVIEKASGQRYADYLQQHIFGPLGMTGAGYDDSSRIIPGRASGYERGPNGWRNAAFIDMSLPFAAGGLYATVDDLLKWDQALYAAKPMSAASMKAAFTDYGHHYGFGWVIDQKWRRERIWHSGGVNGFVSSFQRYPKERVTTVVLSNLMTPTTPDKLAADLAGLCLGETVYPKEVAASAAELARYAGYYRLPSSTAKVEVRGGRLVAHLAGQPDTLLYPAGGARFFAKTADNNELVFLSDGSGHVTGARIGSDGPQAEAQRIDEAEVQRIAAAEAQRLATGAPRPGSEAVLRRLIEELRRGEPDYARMNPGFANIARQQAPALKTSLERLGALTSVAFRGVGPQGGDIFLVKFENGAQEWRIIVGEGGRVEAASIGPA
jgi:D-alanyl-D-alanine carboxypeptidase